MCVLGDFLGDLGFYGGGGIPQKIAGINTLPSMNQRFNDSIKVGGRVKKSGYEMYDKYSNKLKKVFFPISGKPGSVT